MMQTTVAAAAASTVGPGHGANEDSWLTQPHIFAVADGMGGHVGGATASRLAVQSLVLDEHDNLTPDSIRTAIQQANSAILEISDRDINLSGMGTTLAGLALVRDGQGERWLAFNIGDSRIYRLTNGQLTQVSVDHSLVQELIDAQELTHASAAIDARRNVITRALGTEELPTVDYWVLTPNEGERFLLCSDGLSGSLTSLAIQTILSAQPDGLIAAQQLLDAAFAAGARDDVTAVVIDTLSSAHELSMHDTVTLERPGLNSASETTEPRR